MDPLSPHLARLGAHSRPTGSAAATEARAYCADVLRGLGFFISEQEFEYSKFPGAWAATLAGIAVPTIATVLFVTRSSGAGWVTVATLSVLAVAGAFAYLGGPGVLGFGLMRRRGVNLSAVRARQTEPTVWLIAHIDSKWQPVSMIVRVLGIIVMSLALAALIGAALLDWSCAPAILVLVWLGAAPLIASVVGARNHGTLDNASGVATVLEAAALLSVDARVGILISDAEELALAGVRAWLRGRRPAVALNCDSVDDEGDLVLMYTRSAPSDVVSRMRQAASEDGQRLRVLRLIPGILTDSVPLTAAGWAAVTLSRGTIRTLQRIHTSRDTLSHMDGRGIPGAARVLARTATELG